MEPMQNLISLGSELFIEAPLHQRNTLAAADLNSVRLKVFLIFSTKL